MFMQCWPKPMPHTGLFVHGLHALPHAASAPQKNANSRETALTLQPSSHRLADCASQAAWLPEVATLCKDSLLPSEEAFMGKIHGECLRQVETGLWKTQRDWHYPSTAFKVHHKLACEKVSPKLQPTQHFRRHNQQHAGCATIMAAAASDAATVVFSTCRFCCCLAAEACWPRCASPAPPSCCACSAADPSCCCTGKLLDKQSEHILLCGCLQQW